MNHLYQIDAETLEAAARAYSLNGFIKVGNVFSNAEVHAITELYDEQHKDAECTISDGNELRIPPIGSLLENSAELSELVFRKTGLFKVLKAVAGSDVQFAGSDAVHVYNDSIGIHRDTFYDFDFPKILIFLSDMPTRAKFNNLAEQSHGGSFMVMPGTHYTDDNYTARSSTLCQWPYDQNELYAYSNPNFRLVNPAINSNMCGSTLAQERRNRDKYSAFSKISYQKGDVVIFSTRALHALYPLFEIDQRRDSADHHQWKNKKSPSKPNYEPIKLLGVLFIEGFSKHYDKTLNDALVDEDAELNALIRYASTVYNLRLYNTIVDHRESPAETISAVSGKEMGLNRNISQIKNKLARKELESCNLIHRFYSEHSADIDRSAGTNANEIHQKFLKILHKHDKINMQSASRIERNIARIVEDEESTGSIDFQDYGNRKEWSGIAKHLPFINNERIYLIYKRIARYFKA